MLSHLLRVVSFFDLI